MPSVHRRYIISALFYFLTSICGATHEPTQPHASKVIQIIAQISYLFPSNVVFLEKPLNICLLILNILYQILHFHFRHPTGCGCTLSSRKNHNLYSHTMSRKKSSCIFSAKLFQFITMFIIIYPRIRQGSIHVND